MRFSWHVFAGCACIGWLGTASCSLNGQPEEPGAALAPGGQGTPTPGANPGVTGGPMDSDGTFTPPTTTEPTVPVIGPDGAPVMNPGTTPAPADPTDPGTSAGAGGQGNDGDADAGIAPRELDAGAIDASTGSNPLLNGL